jgi:hypothetical protein
MQGQDVHAGIVALAARLDGPWEAGGGVKCLERRFSQMSDHAGFGWVLLALGLVIAGVGLVWNLAPSVPWLGRPPGDIRIEGGNYRFYFPLATCLLLSLALTLVRWVIWRLRG